jgi:hypothetical protein
MICLCSSVPIQEVIIVFFPIFLLLTIILLISFGLDWLVYKIWKIRLIPWISHRKIGEKF